jgi:ComF family protein
MVTQIKNASLQVFQRISHLLLSPTCSVCHGTSDTRFDLCTACHNELPWLEIACQQCALPLASEKAPICGQCLTHPPAFQKSLSLFHYAPPITHMINQLKFKQRLVASRLLGALLAEKVIPFYQTDTLPKLIIPVPLHKKRLQERGFNKALELAKCVSQTLHIPIASTAVKRLHNTAQQSQLPAAKRAGNVRNAFKVEKKLAQHVAIIDDVMTTGSTAQAMSQALKVAGVQRVDVWSIARPTLN